MDNNWIAQLFHLSRTQFSDHELLIEIDETNMLPKKVQVISSFQSDDIFCERDRLHLTNN